MLQTAVKSAATREIDTPDRLREAADSVAAGRRSRMRRRRTVIGLLATALVAGWLLTLAIGDTVYSLADITGVILGRDVPGASFVVGRLRLPRASMAVVAGLAFGLSGATFQTLLRNPLASPDVIGITEGASAAATFAYLTFGVRGAGLSATAVAAGIAVALVVYSLSWRGGVAGTRLILIGIGVAAIGRSLTAAQLDRAPEGQLQDLLRWLTGSLNGTLWRDVAITAIALVALGSVLLTQVPPLSSLQLGDDAASALGVRVERTRLLLIVAAVGLICFAIAASGPIAFVAFLAGPIATRILGPRGSVLLPAALVGGLLVVSADFIGQNLLPLRLPVGVVTGLIGAPYLVFLIARSNNSGGSL